MGQKQQNGMNLQPQLTQRLSGTGKRLTDSVDRQVDVLPAYYSTTDSSCCCWLLLSVGPSSSLCVLYLALMMFICCPDGWVGVLRSITSGAAVVQYFN